MSALPYRAVVLTVSDSASTGKREDTSGPAVKDVLAKEGYQVVGREVVPDPGPRQPGLSDVNHQRSRLLLVLLVVWLQRAASPATGAAVHMAGKATLRAGRWPCTLRMSRSA